LESLPLEQSFPHEVLLFQNPAMKSSPNVALRISKQE